MLTTASEEHRGARRALAPAPPPVRTVGAFELLEDSEQRWKRDPVAALRCDDAIDSPHRRALVLRALRAYDQLRCTEAPRSDPLTVFRRWPICTLVALTEFAAAHVVAETLLTELRKFITNRSANTKTSPPSAKTWLRGWTECWSHLVNELGNVGRLTDVAGSIPHEIAGLPLLLSVSGITDRDRDATPPALALDVERSVVTVREAEEITTVWLFNGDVRGETHGTQVITAPTASIECRTLTGHTYQLPVVPWDDPLLVFAPDGTLLPGNRLEHDELWLLHPEPLPEEAFLGERRVLEQAPSPPGWQGWWLARVALDRTTAIRSVRLEEPGQIGDWRHVHETAPAVTFEFGTPLRGLTDRDGNPVYGDLPEVMVDSERKGWTVDVCCEGEPPMSAVADSAHDVSGVLADLLPRPGLGRFRVRLTGSDGTVVTEAFTLAEGLSVAIDSNRRVRLFAEDGTLVGANIRLSTPRELDAPPAVHLPRAWTHTEITVRTVEGEDAELPLVVSLPYAAVRTRISGESGEWAINPVSLSTADLHADAELDLHLPDAVREEFPTPSITVRDDHGALVQELWGTRTKQTIRYRLKRLLDDARTRDSLTLWLDLPGKPARIATVITPPPATDIETDGTSLHLLGRSQDPAVVTVHAVYAPWEPPQVTSVSEDEDSVVLSPWLNHAGSLDVTVLPVGVAPPDGWPYRGKLPTTGIARRVGTVTGVPTLEEPSAQHIARYLAGEDSLPTEPEALPLLWVCAARADRSPGSPLHRATAQECATHLGHTPLRSLHAAGKAGLCADELVGTLIRSGLAAHPFREVKTPRDVVPLWEHAPLAALLLSSPLLPYLADNPLWDLQELTRDEQELLDVVSRRCTPATLETLSGRRPPDVSGSSVFVNTPDTTDIDHTTALRSLDSNALADELDQVREFASVSGREWVVELVDARRSRGDGYVVPALSVALALVARLAAQGDRAAALVDRQMRCSWTEVALANPDLTTADLTYAEVLVSAHTARTV
ncbi:hypothetical protein [Saccharomonospora iraqiensis]|uniref:hypothetical protein n=1 Tax=Saccharomonospora iraqiensis TaxID=52698 RepID=UPI0012B5699B|nr:hypothetical protein [Saccharomonospora iraqiensis]